MGHVAEDAPGIADNLVRGMALDVADEPDTTHCGAGLVGIASKVESIALW